jgi:nicotinamidase/pyrazinamidase
MKSLIVVDMQNDFCDPKGSLYVEGAELIIPEINAAMEEYDYNLIILTKDWHPKNHCSFKEQGGLWPGHCVQGTWGAEIHPGIDQSKINFIVNKGRDPLIDSYSAFCDNANNTPTYLNYLTNTRPNGSNQNVIDICGVATDYCVRYTAEDASNLDHITFILKYAVAWIEKDKEKQEDIIKLLYKKGIDFRG